MPGNYTSTTAEVHADLTSPLTLMLFPLLETITITGLSWMAIGFIDRPLPPPGVPSFNLLPAPPPETRGIILIIWALLVLWRFVVPLLKQRRYRIKISDTQVIVHQPSFFGKEDSFPIDYIQGISRRGKTLYLQIAGTPAPYVLHNVPKIKKVESLLNQLHHRQLSRGHYSEAL